MGKFCTIIPKFYLVILLLLHGMITYVNKSARAEAIIMKCSYGQVQNNFAPDKELFWKLESGFFGDTIFYRRKLGWQEWCKSEDKKEFPEDRWNIVTWNLEIGDDAARCDRFFMWKDENGNWIPYQYYSEVDFVRTRYHFSRLIGEDGMHKGSKNWTTECEVVR